MLTEKELGNIIYDTLMGNKQFPQFPVTEIENQCLDTTIHPEISFTLDKQDWKIFIIKIED